MNVHLVGNLRQIYPNEVTLQNPAAYNLHCFIFHTYFFFSLLEEFKVAMRLLRWQEKVVVLHLLVKPSFTFCCCNKKRNIGRHTSHFSYFPPSKDPEGQPQLDLMIQVIFSIEHFR